MYVIDLKDFNELSKNFIKAKDNFRDYFEKDCRWLEVPLYDFKIDEKGL